ncbi:MAG: hypothetical protein ABFS21_10130 [Actinomycetota bacterium]
MTSFGLRNKGTEASRGACFLSCAERIDRMLTWGLDPEEREGILRERLADRYEHLTDLDATLGAVAARSIRSALADVWYRFMGGDISAFPVAAMFALIGLGALSDTLISDMPFLLVVFNAVTAAGFIAMAVAGFIRPRELKRAWLLPGAAMASIGSMGGAVLLPVTPDAALYDLFTKLSLGGVAVGLAVVAFSLASRTPNRTWFLKGGAILWSSALVFAVGQFGWAIAATPVYSTRSSTLMVALAAVVGAAVLSRLRHLPIAA